ncbi:YsgD/CorL family protein, partial [Escherichia coli]
SRYWLIILSSRINS